MDDRTATLLADEDARSSMAADEFDHEFLDAHLTDERRKAGLLGEIREAIFGAQDGLVSTLAVVSTVAGATQRALSRCWWRASRPPWRASSAWLPASTSASKSQREIFDAQIVDEREEVHERPGEAEAEVAYMFEEDGLPHDKAAGSGAHHGRSTPTCCSRRWSRRSSG